MGLIVCSFEGTTYHSPYAMQKHIRKFRHKNPDDDVSKEWKSVSDMAISVEKTALLNEIIARSSGEHVPAASLQEAIRNI